MLRTDAEQRIKYLQTRYLLCPALLFTYKYRTDDSVRRFFASAGGGKVSPQGRKFVRDLRITGAGRIERATRRGKTGGTEAAARTGSGNRESPEQRRGNGPAADSGPAVRGTSGIFRRDAVLN